MQQLPGLVLQYEDVGGDERRAGDELAADNDGQRAVDDAVAPPVTMRGWPGLSRMLRQLSSTASRPCSRFQPGWMQVTSGVSAQRASIRDASFWLKAS